MCDEDERQTLEMTHIFDWQDLVQLGLVCVHNVAAPMQYPRILLVLSSKEEICFFSTKKAVEHHNQLIQQITI